MSTNQEIQQRVEAFVANLTNLVRQAAVDSVRDALGAEAPQRRAPGRPRGATKAKPAAAAKVKRVRAGSRRSAADFETTTAAILEHIQANDGCSVSEIGAAVGLKNKDLQLPMRKLIAEGRIHMTGQRRGARYHAGKGRGRVAKKASKRKAKRRGRRAA